MALAPHEQPLSRSRHSAPAAPPAAALRPRAVRASSRGASALVSLCPLLSHDKVHPASFSAKPDLWFREVCFLDVSVSVCVFTSGRKLISWFHLTSWPVTFAILYLKQKPRYVSLGQNDRFYCLQHDHGILYLDIDMPSNLGWKLWFCIVLLLLSRVCLLKL